MWKRWIQLDETAEPKIIIIFTGPSYKPVIDLFIGILNGLKFAAAAVSTARPRLFIVTVFSKVRKHLRSSDFYTDI